MGATGVLSGIWILTATIITPVGDTYQTSTLEISRTKNPTECQQTADLGNRYFKSKGILYKCVPGGPFRQVISQ